MRGVEALSRLYEIAKIVGNGVGASALKAATGRNKSKECIMSRPLTFLLAAAVAAGSIATSVAPAAAGGAASVSQSGNIVLAENGWRDDNEWNRHDDWRHHHRDHRRHHDNYQPGFSFNFGAPGFGFYVAPQRHARDCYRAWNGQVYCRQ